MSYAIVIRILCFLALSVVATSRQAWAQENFDQPDAQFESKIYDINQRFNSQPVADSEWLSVVGSRRSENYRIQTGDTLWDISKTFFGDGRYWPKLWSVNSNIENPHQILPRKRIVFLAGTMAEAPTFNVVEDTEISPSAPTYVSLEEQGENLIDPEEPRVIGGKPKIPKAVHVSAPVMKTLPSSFKPSAPPEYGEYDKTGLDVRDLVARNVSQTNQLIPFIAVQELPASVGRVTEMENGYEFAGNQQIVYVKLDRPPAPDQEFTTFYSMGKLKNDEISKGLMLEVGGRIQIKGLVEGMTDVYRAAVLESVNPVRKDSVITTLTLPSVNFSMDRGVSSTVARVVGGEYDRVRRVVGLGSVVFLQAENKPLTVGEVLTVESLRKNRNSGTEYPKAKRPVAVVKVANVDGDLATAAIIRSLEETSVGDVTGGPIPVTDPVATHNSKIIEIKNSVTK